MKYLIVKPTLVPHYLFLTNPKSISTFMQNQNKSDQRFTTGKIMGQLPLIIWLVFIGNLMAFAEGNIMGYRLSGFGWFLPFCTALLLVLVRIKKIKFPFWIWLPWIMIVFSYYLNSDYPALQRSVQILCPVVIGMAVSTYRYEEQNMERILQILKYFAICLYVIIVFRLGILFTGILPPTTGLAGHSMTAILFNIIFATSYSFGNKIDLRWWWFMATVPVIAVTRTAIAVIGLTLPLSWGPMKFSRRIILILIIIILGFMLFHSPRIQQKSFRSGEGEMSDVLSKDFSDNARFFMWKNFDEQIKRKPWFGYGTGAGEKFVRQITNDQSGYPHNDWRLTLYDHGIFGTAIYVLCILGMMVHAYRQSKKALDKSRLFFLAGASSFIPFMLLMYTDNIMVYVSFFGNLQFTLLGVAYGAKYRAEPSVKIKKRLKVRW